MSSRPGPETPESIAAAPRGSRQPPRHASSGGAGWCALSGIRILVACLVGETVTFERDAEAWSGGKAPDLDSGDT